MPRRKPREVKAAKGWDSNVFFRTFAGNFDRATSLLNSIKIGSMRKLLLLAVCLASLSLMAQNNEIINKKDASGRKQGVWKKMENGKKVYEGQFKDDVPYGTFKYFHENGKLKSTTEFIQGVHKVKTVMYHENEHKASEGVFIDQLKDGEWKYYSNTDKLIAIEHYAMGKRTGEWKVFSAETGILLEERNYLNDKLNGLYKTYYIDGSVSLEQNYLDGKLNGKSIAYYPKNVMSSTGNYLKGQRIGSWDFFDTKGKIRSSVEYKDQRVLKTYIYLYIMGQGQKLNQDLIAYFLRKGDKTAAVLRNGKQILFDETLDDVALWADFTVFTKIAPSVIAASDAIVDYTPVEDAANDAIIVKLKPATDEEIYSEGMEAKMVKALFNKEMPKE